MDGERALMFAAILRNGGSPIAHPDTFTDLDSKPFMRLLMPELIDAPRIASKWCAAGQLFAVAVPMFNAFPRFTLGDPLYFERQRLIDRRISFGLNGAVTA